MPRRTIELANGGSILFDSSEPHIPGDREVHSVLIGGLAVATIECGMWRATVTQLPNQSNYIVEDDNLPYVDSLTSRVFVPGRSEETHPLAVTIQKWVNRQE